MQARKEYHDILKKVKGKTLQPRIRYTARLSFRIEGEIKTFSDMQNLKQFINTKATLKEVLKSLLYVEKKWL